MFDYDSILSGTVSALKPSGIRKFFDLIENMEDVVSLTVGQPDFITPWHIRQAGIESLEYGKTYYTSNAGTLELRREISRHLREKFGLEYEAESEVIVTVGGSEAIDLAIRALVDPGDEVIIPVPSFVCYAPLTEMAGGKAVFLNTLPEDKFKLTAKALKKAITPRTKLLVLPFPNNPTGAIMTADELEEIAKVLRGTNIMVLSDEIYADLTYGRRHVSIASLEGMRERTVYINGFSKSYAMTGWRMGYACAPKPVAKQMLKIHQYCIMCAPTTAQYAAVEALRNGDSDIEMMVAEYDRRRRYVYNGLKEIGIDAFMPEGAFYIYPDIRKFGLSSDEFCERLLYEKRCAIVPGTAFGDCGEGFARISYAYSVKHLTKAIECIKEFTDSLN